MNARKNIIAVAVAAVLGVAPFASVVHAASDSNAMPSATTSAPAQPAKGDASAVARNQNAQPGKTQSGGSGDTSTVAQSPKAQSGKNDTSTVAQNGNRDQGQNQDKAIFKTVDEAAQAIREIHQARLALFEGQTDAASKLVSSASDNLGAAHDSLAQHALKMSDAKGSTKAMPGKDASGGSNGSGNQSAQAKTGDEAYVPIETSVSLAEGFVPAEQHKGALDQAGKQMSQGDQKGAVESLRLADIDVAVSAVVLPVNSSIQHVKDAVKLMGEQKYFEANLALKAVEDSVSVETWNAAGIPVQGTTASDSAPTSPDAPTSNNG